jgi:hypothetical protein
MKSLLSLKIALTCSFLSIIDPSNGLAMQRADDPNVLDDAKKFAKEFPYATGVLLDKMGAMSSILFLNDTTALTTTHSFVGNTKGPYIVVATDEIQLHSKYDSGFNWEDTFSGIKQAQLPYSSVKKQHPFCKYTECSQAQHTLSEYFPDNLSKMIESWERGDEDSVSKILEEPAHIEGKEYKHVGPDISVIKLHSPIKLEKKPFPLSYFDPQNLEDFEAYAFGTPEKSMTSDGKDQTAFKSTGKSEITTYSSTAFLAHNIKSTKDKQYYFSRLYCSCADVAENFSCENLPSPTERRFIGRIMYGMSGGPLVFKSKNGEYDLGGLIKTQASMNVKGIIDSTTESIKKEIEEDSCWSKGIKSEYGVDVQDWLKYLNSKYNEKYSIYNVFQALTPDSIEKINKLL